MTAGESSIHRCCRCFELLGIDVMLDAKMKPYLIEACTFDMSM